MRDNLEERRAVVLGIMSMGAQEYGKLRKNTYEVKQRRSGLFRSKHTEKYFKDVRTAEIGFVLSGLAAGLLESHSDREGYLPDSLYFEGAVKFRRAVNNLESVEDLGKCLDFDEDI